MLVHDGARPFLSGEVIDRCLAGALETGAAVAGVPAVDTVKVCDSGRMVRYTTPRKDTWLIQSPQTFRRKLLLEAYEQADPLDPSLTDDCMVMEQAGFPVQVVMGSRDNFKVTRPEDYQHALALCRREEERPAPASVWRTGIGQDSPRFEEPATGKPLIWVRDPFRLSRPCRPTATVMWCSTPCATPFPASPAKTSWAPGRTLFAAAEKRTARSMCWRR